MDILDMRERIKKRLTTEEWGVKVDELSDSQVYLIFANPDLKIDYFMNVLTPMERRQDAIIMMLKHHGEQAARRSFINFSKAYSEPYTCCLFCGAHLDPDEKCDCTESQE